MIPLSLFKSRTFSGTNLLTLLLYAALGGVFFFVPFNLIQVQGYSATTAGVARTASLLSIAVFSIVVQNTFNYSLDRRMTALKIPLDVQKLLDD